MPSEILSIDELSERWGQLVVRAREINWGTAELGELGKQFGVPWFETRSREKIADYLAFDAKELVLLHGFGRGKLARLCEILSASLDPVNLSRDPGNEPIRISEFVPEQITLPPARTDARETLEEWSVTGSFPCRLARFSNRLQNFLKSQGGATLGDLLNMWEDLGFSGLIQQKNLGKKTVAEIRAFVSALESGDRPAASRVIPLAVEEEGISLAAAVAMVAENLTPFKAHLLHQRLVVGKTLEESAEGTGLTRERVRQIESKFLGNLREFLEYFTVSYAELVELWYRGEDWFGRICPTDHTSILEAAFEAIFNDLPQAVARRLNEENEREALLEEIRTHSDLWFGGIPIHEFLSTRVGGSRLPALCVDLGCSGEFRIDHGTGSLHPRKTGLFRTTLAILAMEDDPVPITWLIELLRSTGYHPTISREILARRKWRWERTEGFPAWKILWDE